MKESERVCVCVSECVCLWCVNLRETDSKRGRVHERVNGSMYEREKGCEFVLVNPYVNGV